MYAMRVGADAQVSAEVRRRYESRLMSGYLARVDDPVSHFCADFLPCDAETRTVFVVSHKKSGL